MKYKVKVEFKISSRTEPRGFCEEYYLEIYYLNPFTRKCDTVRIFQNAKQGYHSFMNEIYEKVLDKKWVTEVVEKDIISKNEQVSKEESKREIERKINSMSYGIEIEIS